MNKFFSLTMLAVLLTGNFACTAQKELIYMGSYTQRESKGISLYEFNRSALSFSLMQTVSDFTNPNFLAFHPQGGFLYAVYTAKKETGENVDAVAAFSLNKKDGTITAINQVKGAGKGACHISLDKTGKWLFVSYYTSGSLEVFSVGKDGSLGAAIQFIQHEGKGATPRQRGPNVHSSLVSPDNKFLYVADLGTDKVNIYAIDHKTGMLSPASQAFGVSNPGSGPRHFTFHPKNSMFYVADEISSTLTVFDRNPSTGALTLVQSVSTLPEGFSGRNSVADIHTTPDGRFVYVTNRGHNSIAIFAIKEDGKVEFLAHEPVQGDHPRNFLVDPKGEILMVANQMTDNVVVFKIDSTTGLLKYSGITLTVPAAVCLKWQLLK
jgi:6-phosphogluconolactonase